jgi:hypothetical protein
LSNICGTNADSDNYFSLTLGHTGTCQATSKAYTDCNDNNGTIYQTLTCYTDGDHDGHGTGSAVSTCTGATCNLAGKSSDSLDCNDANAAIWQTISCYTDVDLDGYGTGSGSSVCGSCPSGQVGNNQDCYDSNANAKPYQTFYFTTNRGDGSWDYDCSGGADKDLTCQITTSCNLVETCSSGCGGFNCLTMTQSVFSCGETNTKKTCRTVRYNSEGCSTTTFDWYVTSNEFCQCNSYGGIVSSTLTDIGSQTCACK